MLDPSARDLEALEAINQDAAVRQIILRMAGLARGGRLGGFIDAVDSDTDLDDETKESVLELARDEVFLLAAEEYLRATRYLH
jgi:enoyl-CoA hydratase/carnithine racemase